MFSDKENINILTSLLIGHGVKHAVVCPGSRNAPIVHNLDEAPEITCHSVTDERSAAFYALGMAETTGSPVAVCVTSGTALLNVLPAVAEAFYRHVALVVVSADRPAEWIGQQDGQTLPQPDALGRFVTKAVSLPEPTDEGERRYCNRLVNEALIAAKRHGGRPVHINVPISEPLFAFTKVGLPRERVIRMVEATESADCHEALGVALSSARRPMIVVGQLAFGEAEKVSRAVRKLRNDVVVVGECLSLAGDEADGGLADDGRPMAPQHVDKVLARMGEAVADYLPDFILYVGGTLVSKRLKQFLRQAVQARTWIVNRGGEVYDTFLNLEGVVDGRCGYVLEHVVTDFYRRKAEGRVAVDTDFVSRWAEAMERAAQSFERFVPRYSQLSAVKAFFKGLPARRPYTIHAANSMSVRLVGLFATGHVMCNRGVNGIEGSLSTAAGSSLVGLTETFCVIGDLSFFYDQNALWPRLGRNFKVLLLNNHGGGIFATLPGLSSSGAYRSHVAARHALSAQGVCAQCGVDYLAAHDERELEEAMATFMRTENERPVVLEVFTDSDADAEVMKEYYQSK